MIVTPFNIFRELVRAGYPAQVATWVIGAYILGGLESVDPLNRPSVEEAIYRITEIYGNDDIQNP